MYFSYASNHREPQGENGDGTEPWYSDILTSPTVGTPWDS